MTNNAHRALAALARVATVGLVAMAALTLTDTQDISEAPASTPITVQDTAQGSTDLDSEIWWTTTDCPAGVQVPCLDPEAFTDHAHLPPVDIYVLEPGEVSDAMWDALIDMGYRGDPTDGREVLYAPMSAAAAACQTDADCAQVQLAMDQAAADEGCWLEHKAGLPDEALYGNWRLMPAGSTPISCDLV